VSASPFYHPILRCCAIQTSTFDSSEFEDAHGDHSAAGGRRRTTGARGGLHKRLFGKRPVGLWPSEGSVSDAMVPLAAAAGFEWMATDELILARTLGVTFSRDGRGRSSSPSASTYLTWCEPAGRPSPARSATTRSRI